VANHNFKVKKGLEVGTGVTISGIDGNINISGILTATQFAGDGSGLTGVTASGTGVVVQEEGSNIGTAATINFIGSNVTAALSGGIANVTVSGGSGGLSNVVEDTTPQLGGNLDLNGKNITGIGSISITGSFNATGVSTFQENVVFQSTASFGDNDKINAGTGNDLQIYHNGTNSFIDNTTGSLSVRGASGNHIRLQALSGEESIVAAANGSVDLYYDNSKKLETTNTGVTVTGNIVGVTSAYATKFYGDGSGLTGLPAAGISDVVADTTPQLGGNLDLNGKNITGTGDIVITGVSTVGGVGIGTLTQLTNAFGITDTLNFGNDMTMFHMKDGTFGTSNRIVVDEHNLFIGTKGEGGGNLYTDIITVDVGNDAYTSNTAHVKLGYGAAGTKLQTTNTGVTVTGTLAATAVTGDGSGLTDLTGASAGTYGASSAVPIITVDSNGRITGISTTGVSGGGGGGGIDNIVQDTTPQLGGDLDLNGNDISGTGNITITSTDAGSSAGPEFKLWRNSASPADADYLGQIKFAGESDTGVERNYAKITGKISDASNGTEDGIIEIAHIKAGSQNISARWTSSELKFLNGTDISMADGLKLLLGTGDDADIYHDGSDAYFRNGTGQLLVRGNDIKLQSYLGETYATFANNGAVSLYHDNALRLATTNTGVSITDNLNVAGVSTFQGNVNLGDNDKAIFGAGNDLQIYHNNVNYIDVSQPLYFRSTHGSGTQFFYFQATSGENSLVLNHNGSVELYHDNSKKLETTSAGVTVTGTLAATAVTGDGSGLTGLPAAGITTANTNVQVTYNITASGNNYRITGPGYDASENNPDIYLVRGQRYRFINGTGSGHPFRIQSDTSGTAYTDGVSGSQNGTQDFNVQNDAPVRLYYQCTIHSGMIGNIYIVGGSDWRMTDVNTSTAPEIYTTRNVGIGTDNPNSTGNNYGSLDISGSSGGEIFISDDGTAKGNLFNYSADTNLVGLAAINASGELLFSTGGYNERMRITSGGKVGIGTDDPLRQLDIFSTTHATAALKGDTQSSLFFVDSADSNIGQISYIHADNYMYFRVNDAERLRIASNGGVLIGGHTTAVDGGNAPNIEIVNTSTSTLSLARNDTSISNGNDIAAIRVWGNDSNGTYQQCAEILAEADGDHGTGDKPTALVFKVTADGASSPTERLRIASDGKIGIGTDTPNNLTRVSIQMPTAGGAGAITVVNNTTGANLSNIVLRSIDNNGGNWADAEFRAEGYSFKSGTQTRLRITSGGDIGIGNNAPSCKLAITDTAEHTAYANATPSVGACMMQLYNNPPNETASDHSTIQFGVYGGTHNRVNTISAVAESASNKKMAFTFCTDDNSGRTEKMRITGDGILLVGKTSNTYANQGVRLHPFSDAHFTRNDGNVIAVRRNTSDGTLLDFWRDGSSVGNITVSSGTVSLTGAHLSRWTQLPGNAERTEILMGTVLSNLDEMCEWTDEENIQLNRMKVSDVEGDKNVAGVFQSWDDDDDTYLNDFYCAMTGDFIIRIAQGVTVARGDLLMSAGDGTAKPQDDDIVRSKTIAKVTSTTVSATYADGSYCVPCVLMAC